MKIRVPFLLLAAYVLTFTVAYAQQGGLDFSVSNGSGNSTTSTIEKIAGEEVCFTLTAKDANGNIRRDWNTTGNATTLTLKYSSNPATTANTDTSMQSWSADPLDFSWAQMLHNGLELAKISADEWTIPATAFDSLGQARICLVHTRADTGVYIEVSPFFAGLNQESAHISFAAGAVTNFLVELTSATPAGNQVYFMRPYEIIVSPRDRYLNVSDETVRARFSARFPGEYESNLPGLADIFSGEVFITGPTNYLIASRIERELPADQLQWLMCFDVNTPAIRGVTNPYEVLSHEPVDFVLQSPPNHTTIELNAASARHQFTWERPAPPDPYTNIQISRFSTQTATDDVTYTLVFIDSVSLTRAVRFPSNSTGTEAQLSLTGGQLEQLLINMSGQQTTGAYSLAWYVEATDGLYTTLSSPPKNDPNSLPGWYIHLKNNLTSVESPTTVVPGSLRLEQNYPNPFNPSTTIGYALPQRGKVTLKVYDLLGGEIATVINNEERNAGEYRVSFNASSLPSGLYMYKLQFNGQTITRRMTLMK